MPGRSLPERFEIVIQLFLKTLARDATAFCKNTGHGASGRKKICATTKNWPIGKIEYVATVDLINSYLIDRFNRISLEFAVYLVNSLHINYLCSQTVAIAIWAKYQPYGQTSAM